MRAFVTGIAGTTLRDDERAFLSEAQPWGVIIFKRNAARPRQLRVLIEEVRTALGRSAPVLVDQEGGRVQRLGPPHWREYPPAAAYGDVFDRDRPAGAAAARLGARLIAADLTHVGIDVDCMPVADVPVAGADNVIGDRAFGMQFQKVAALAEAFARGLADGGVLPVLKHIPGHGRATADSHRNLPVVTAEEATLTATDFAAFRALCALPLAMTAHVVFTAFDPIAPATTSAVIVSEVIRGSIGYRGLLMSDDISMGALRGSLGQRMRAVIAAGCDLALHCSGEIGEMREVAAAAPVLAGEAAGRAAAALAVKEPPMPIDLAGARKEFLGLMRGIWSPAGGVSQARGWA